MNFLFVYVLVLATSFLRTGGAAGVYAVNGWKKGIVYGIVDMLGISYYFSFPSLNETWWYISLAIFLIFIVPILMKLYKSFGKVLVFIGIFYWFFGVSDRDFNKTLLCVIMGICCAEENILENLYKFKICNERIINGLLKIIFWIISFSVLFIIRDKLTMSYWVDSIVPIACCEFCLELSGLCPQSERIMAFVGSHSMNMFLIHTIIFEYYFTDFIYGFKNWVFVLFALFATSLLISIVIESLKKISGYNKLIRRVLR